MDEIADTKKPTADVTLSAHGMGVITEEEYDNWVSYVIGKLSVVSGVRCTVSCAPFGDAASPDRIVPTSDWSGGLDITQSVKDAIVTLWESYCAEDFPSGDGCE